MDFQDFEWRKKAFVNRYNTYQNRLLNRNNDKNNFNNNSNNNNNHMNENNNDDSFKYKKENVKMSMRLTPWIKDIIHSKNINDIVLHISMNLCNKSDIEKMQPKVKNFYDNFCLANHNNQVDIFLISHVTHARRCIYAFGHGGRPNKYYSLFLYEHEIIDKQKFNAIINNDKYIIQRFLLTLKMKFENRSKPNFNPISQEKNESLNDENGKINLRNVTNTNLYKTTNSNNSNNVIHNNNSKFNIHTS